MKQPPFLILVSLVALTVLSLNMFLPALADMAEEFGVAYGTMSLAVGGYLALTAVLQLVLGPLSDRVGRRPVVLAGLTVFTLASVGCAMAETAQSFLAWRMVQGAVVAGSVLSSAMVRDTSNPAQAVRRLGQISMVMAVAPMLGPMAGGALAQLQGWRAIFGLFAVIGAVLLVLCLWRMPETRAARGGGPPPRLAVLLREKSFWAFALCASFSISAFFGFLAGAALVADRAFGLGPGAVGLALGSITGGFALGSLITTQLARSWSVERIIVTARILPCVGLSLGLLLALTTGGTVYSLLAATLTVGIANGLTLPATTSGALSVHPDQAGAAAGLLGAATLGTGALITSLTGWIVQLYPTPAALLSVMLIMALAALAMALWAAVLARNRVLGGGTGTPNA